MYRKEALAFYYGKGRLQQLRRYAQVVLQTWAYTPIELQWLRRQGTRPLAYLSLGEDQPTPAPWHRKTRNPDWNTVYVDPAHPDWIRSRLDEAQKAIDMGFEGLFLDTLDTVTLNPQDRGAMLQLIAQLRALVGSRRLYANRGFYLLPELSSLVDGVVLESFSTTWTPRGYRVLPAYELEYNLSCLFRLQGLGLELYALDYTDRFWLEGFARARAMYYGLPTFVSNRDLTRL
ncbi:endo alpha-1,4 polygalactosaminidase [Meiothermus ruber]|jgi:hypothetical protein|uniref:Glycoside-hydrolase family GH114 TIM-barrel domain-containing protein n=1 Tax=Meiothermus ruber (strain ATCC 35948 / DSM 1279 / VKM B-1258 / 21) TaxID=504728 RepID=D3PT10_MEIRD|nr:endo alpha-1,4 polygalactosaminidase [Meiothermus ruber]ADD28593.1 hypothetical protein Mrub_1836 [Meiothermus ruber DSM 1279]AGK05962.1 hypothetical protein K649_13380 [Meiothermus ruber DSM 1279]MCL6530277.1 endo alpha-1,4 polygalactosaminidase [Meiothermus ruber]GAO75553.1 putative uncharacterized protein [Meiothermus ruber H328]